VKKQDAHNQNCKGSSAGTGISGTKWLPIMTGDESWMFWLNFDTAQWLPEGSPSPQKPRLTIGAEKSMIYLFFTLRRFFAFSLLGDGDRFHSGLMTNAIFLEIGTKIAKQHAQKASKT
jgi:hypothetical protein